MHSENLISEVPGRIILRDYLSLGKGFLGTVRGSGNEKKWNRKQCKNRMNL